MGKVCPGVSTIEENCLTSFFFENIGFWWKCEAENIFFEVILITSLLSQLNDSATFTFVGACGDPHYWTMIKAPVTMEALLLKIWSKLPHLHGTIQIHWKTSFGGSVSYHLHYFKLFWHPNFDFSAASDVLGLSPFDLRPDPTGHAIKPQNI